MSITVMGRAEALTWVEKFKNGPHGELPTILQRQGPWDMETEELLLVKRYDIIHAIGNNGNPDQDRQSTIADELRSRETIDLAKQSIGMARSVRRLTIATLIVAVLQIICK